MSKTVYPRAKITLSNGTYKYSSFVTKRKIESLYTMLTAQNGIYDGTCTVEYSRDFYNEFEFSDEKDFKYKLGPCIEKELINGFTTAQEG